MGEWTVAALAQRFGWSDEETASVSSLLSERGLPTAPTLDPADGRDPSPRAPVGLPARYRLGGRLGQGGMGEVLRARDERLGCDVAIKLLAWHLVDDPQARQRFTREARITARLRHPGVVSVHDLGELDNGRLWYAMDEVRGRTLHTLLRTSRPTLRRGVGLLQRAAEAVAHAHESGVVHRDLKPENLMIGEFSDVRVMDWGLAAVGDEAPMPQSAAGAVLGTPVWMPPEQARGEPVTPAADVYALGAMLYRLLAGRPPYTTRGREAWLSVLEGPPPPLPDDADPALRKICEYAMSRVPTDRYTDASALWRALRDWSEGAARQAQALAAIQEAEADAPAIQDLRARSDALQTQAEATLGSLRPFDPVDLKRPAWRALEEAAGLRREAAVREADWLTAVHGALRIQPGLPEAHALLARHHRDALVRAEQARDPEGVAHAEALLRAHDDGTHAAFLAGSAHLSLRFEPDAVEVTVARFVARDRRLVPETLGAPHRGPTLDMALPAGSYLLTARAPGRATVRCPVLLERGERWDGVRPGDPRARPVVLPLAADPDPDDCVVPGGWMLAGGDPLAADSFPRTRVWVDGFVIKRAPVTNRLFLEFLNDLADAGRVDEALQHAPRLPGHPGAEGRDRLAIVRGPGDRFSLPNALSVKVGGPDHPVTMVTWHAAMAFARWFSAREGRRWTLPLELEWEKAARGVDGRACAWGDHVEPTWANVLGSRADAPRIEPTDAHPGDESVYGVRGTVGNVREWCLDVWRHQPGCDARGLLLRRSAAPEDDDFRAVRGGAWLAVPDQGRAAARFADRPDHRHTALGFRLCRSL
ncbi:MAG: SUMF1/EgtB/PvdO family nonheme iron enzyme [Alphaproteobacteria bacterium]|nr:SUMF1/EgtB/PvdO family nonheme iron enzyme [Alphaproteobacteria bacterium]